MQEVSFVRNPLRLLCVLGVSAVSVFLLYFTAETQRTRRQRREIPKNHPMEKSIYQREIEVASELARQAGAVLLEHYYSPFLVEQKVNALDELEEVTAADREANELIVGRLREEFPDDGILAEESTDTEH